MLIQNSQHSGTTAQLDTYLSEQNYAKQEVKTDPATNVLIV